MPQVAVHPNMAAPVLPRHPHHAGANLTLQSTDGELLAALQADNALLDRVQAAAQVAYLAARVIRSGPIQSVDLTWRDAQTASLTAIANAGGRGVIGTRCAADWTARVAMLRVAMTVGDNFRDLVTRYDTISEDERARLHAHDTLQGTARAAQVGHVGLVQMAPSSFNAHPFLASLAQRGIHLSISTAGAILASPGRALTAHDRETLRMHKVATVAALDDAEVF
jgi:hypothetical protein